MARYKDTFNRMVIEKGFGGKENYKAFRKYYPHPFRINSGGLDAIVRDDGILESQGKIHPKQSSKKHKVCVKTVYNKLNSRKVVPQITLSLCVCESGIFLH